MTLIVNILLAVRDYIANAISSSSHARRILPIAAAIRIVVMLLAIRDFVTFDVQLLNVNSVEHQRMLQKQVCLFQKFAHIDAFRYDQDGLGGNRYIYFSAHILNVAQS